jgi:hypothetical protein
LCLCAYTKNHKERAAESRDELVPSHRFLPNVGGRLTLRRGAVSFGRRRCGGLAAPFVLRLTMRASEQNIRFGTSEAIGEPLYALR